MSFQEEINNIVDEYVELLPVDDSKMMAQSEVKASKFLMAIAQLARIRDHLMNAKIKLDSVKNVVYADAINNAPGTNAPTKQANAEANASYLTAAEQVAIIDNQLSYTKTMIDVFNNAHILYRGLMKGEI